MLARLLCLAALFQLLALGGCYGPSTHLYEGPERSDQEIAILEWDVEIANLFIDNRRIDERSQDVRLPPGVHTISYGGYAYKIGWRGDAGTVNFEAGHTYRVHFWGCILLCGYKATAWMEDLNTGEIVFGSDVPH